MTRLLPGIAAALSMMVFTAQAADTDRRVRLDERHRSLLNEYCLGCHNAEKQKGKFRLDNLPFVISNVEEASRWQKVLNAVNSGEMPPPDEKKLPAGSKADFLDDLAHAMVTARRNLADQNGRVTMRRLNRREYRNTVRELLGVEINVNELPADTGIGGFDTAGANLFMSGDQFDQYLALAREALDEAFEIQSHASFVKTHRFEAEEAVERVRSSLQERMDYRKNYIRWTKAVDEAASRPENRPIAVEIRAALKNAHPWDFYHSWKKIPGAPAPADYGFVDAEFATHMGEGAWRLVPYQTYFIVQPELKNGAFLTVGDNQVNPYFAFSVPGDWPSGDYVIRVRIAATREATPDRRFMEFGVPFTALSTHEVTGTMEEPQVIEIPMTVSRQGDRGFFIREKGTFDSNEQGIRKQGEGYLRNGVGPEFALWVDWAEVERKGFTGLNLPPGLAALRISPSDDVASLPAAEIRSALERFSIEAFRGAIPSSDYLDRLVRIYETRRQDGVAAKDALKEVLAVILASPRFLYLAEPLGGAKSRPLTGNELAVRLSYFLWGSPPDVHLRERAGKGDLVNPDAVISEINRLLEDARAVRFVLPFTHQWLGLDRLDFFRFNGERFPRFDESTKKAARSEVYETVAFLVRENESLKHLLRADFVVVNGLLAQYYGLEGVQGDLFRKVPLPEGSARGGLMGMAAIHAMGSNGEHTSPVERGAWVLRKLLNDPPPPAPPNVPQISRLDGKPLTTKERLLVHQEQPQCASCHRKIDPIGLGLENFDAAGQWRTEDPFTGPGGGQSWKIDSSGAFHKGPEFKNFFELRKLVEDQADAFARGFSRALLEYALGRPAGFGDEHLIENMVKNARQENYSVRQFIYTLVLSEAFLTK